MEMSIDLKTIFNSPQPVVPLLDEGELILTISSLFDTSISPAQLEEHYKFQGDFDGILRELEDDPIIPPEVPFSQEKAGDSPTSKYDCPICYASFESKGLSKDHFMVNHTFQYLNGLLPPSTSQAEVDVSIEKEIWKGEFFNDGNMSYYVCPHCTSHFRMRISFQCHLLQCHPGKIINAIKTCITSRSMAFSESSSAKKAKPSYPCSFCSQKLSNKKSLDDHNALVHSSLHYKEHLPPNTTQEEVRTVVSKLLSIAPKTKDGLRMGCPVCPLEYRRRSSVRYHVIQKHPDAISTEIEEQRGSFEISSDCENGKDPEVKVNEKKRRKLNNAVVGDTNGDLDDAVAGAVNGENLDDTDASKLMVDLRDAVDGTGKKLKGNNRRCKNLKSRNSSKKSVDKSFSRKGSKVGKNCSKKMTKF